MKIDFRQQGSYWAVDESFDNGNNLTSRKRKVNVRRQKKRKFKDFRLQFEEIQSSIPIMPSSPSSNLMQQNTVFYTNNNPMICGEIGSVGGQSSSTDESDSTTSFAANVRVTAKIIEKRAKDESFRYFHVFSKTFYKQTI